MLTARLLNIADLPQLRDFYLGALRREPEAFIASYESTANSTDDEWQEKWLDRSTTAGIFDNATMVGISSFSVNSETPDTGEISNDYMAPAYRRRGLYAALLKIWALQFMANPLLQFLLRGFLPSNKISQALSARYGFKDIGTTKATLPDGTLETFALTGLNRDGVRGLLDTLHVPAIVNLNLSGMKGVRA